MLVSTQIGLLELLACVQLVITEIGKEIDLEKK